MCALPRTPPSAPLVRPRHRQHVQRGVELLQRQRAGVHVPALQHDLADGLALLQRLLGDRCRLLVTEVAVEWRDDRRRRLGVLAGAEPDLERTREYAESSPSIVTPLNKYIGYEEAASIAKQSLKERRTIREVVLERGHVENGKLTLEQLDAALDVLAMTGATKRG